MPLPSSLLNLVIGDPGLLFRRRDEVGFESFVLGHCYRSGALPSWHHLSHTRSSPRPSTVDGKGKPRPCWVRASASRAGTSPLQTSQMQLRKFERLFARVFAMEITASEIFEAQQMSSGARHIERGGAESRADRSGVRRVSFQ